jgi:uncharacterized ion transporter superfamily protein YfcC
MLLKAHEVHKMSLYLFSGSFLILVYYFILKMVTHHWPFQPNVNFYIAIGIVIVILYGN